MSHDPALDPILDEALEETNSLKERDDRLNKLNLLTEEGVHPYPERYEKTHASVDLLSVGEDKLFDADVLKAEKRTTYAIAGRMTMFRTHGKLSFAHILDQEGKIQVAFMQDVLGKDEYEFLQKRCDIGDFLGIQGDLFRTKHGEITLLATNYTFLGKALRPLPAKFHGLKDKETMYRQRYLDLIANEDTKKRFLFRSKFVQTVREFYWSKGFFEVETPILCNNASGALATPFKTHHAALDLDIYLRIAPETYLKELIIGGFEKVFEMGRVFRNEGIDPSHLQDFTMIEHYAAYWNYEDNISFTEEMFMHLFKKLGLPTTIPIRDRDGNINEVDFTPPWPRKTLRDLILEYSGIDIETYANAEELRAAITAKGIKIDGMEKLGHGNLIDHLYKKVARPHLVAPVFVTKHPIELSPLARKNDENPQVVDRFQLVIGTWEVNNAYSELVDPIDQAERFNFQSSAKEGGDADAHGKDDEYVEAMEYGMPPISGYGMGIDRIIALLTDQENLRDVVLFPLMRPKK